MSSVVSFYTLKADNPHSTLPGHDFIRLFRDLKSMVQFQWVRGRFAARTGLTLLSEAGPVAH